MRARNIKPAFFKNENLAQCDPMAQLLFIGLWCLADRDGRLEDRVLRIKAEVFPYQNIDIDPLLNRLAELGFITRYQASGLKVIQIINFKKHQKPHANEQTSELPPMEQALATKVASTCDQGGKHLALNEESLTTESPSLKSKSVVGGEESKSEPAFRSTLPADNVELIPVAEKIEGHYRKAVGSSNSHYARQAVIGAIQAVIAERLGDPKELLCLCADGYAAECERNNRGPPKRSSAKSFFTEQWRAFVAYKPQIEDVDAIKKEAQRLRLEFNGNERQTASTGRSGDGKVLA